MSTQPTDAELKAMWQLHAADIGGIFYYARAVLAKWGQPSQATEPVARLEIESLKAQLHAAKQINAAQFGLLAASIPGSALRASHGQAKALVLKYGNDPLNLVFQVELAHGIKGGQHGTE